MAAKTGPTDIVLMRRAEAMRGLWQCPGRPQGVFFHLTRLSETEPYAYGWYTDAAGKPIPKTPMVKLALNHRGSAPAGFRRVK